MASIFDLKTNVSELSSANEGTSRMEYDQHPPTRDVTTTNFPNGAIHFRFQTSGQKWWMPSKSYIRMRAKLTDGAGVPLTTAQNIGPNMSLMANLFQSAEMRINDKVVSRIADFMPQVDALEQRLTKSSSWLDSVGEATNWWQSSAGLRIAEVSSDGQIVKDTVAITTPDTTTIDTAIGTYTAATTVAYDAGTGVITFAVAAPNSDTVWQVGDFIILTTGTIGDGTLNVKAEVLTAPANLTLTVRADWPADIAANADIRFSRIRPGTSTAPASRRVSTFEMTWTPPLSLFKIGHALPSGKYELVLNPQTSNSYQRRAIESTGADKIPWTTSNNNAFRFSVQDMYLYINTVEGPRADDITYLVDLEQTRCQSDKIDSSSFQQKNFDVSPSTYALTVAYQDLRAGNDTRFSPSKFKSWTAGGNSGEELKLNRFFVNYAGQNLPAPDADPSFIPQTGVDPAQGVDYTTQRYTESAIYSGAYFDTGGAETIEDYHDRGAYYYQSWPRDGTDRSTRVNVHQQFNSADVVNMRCLLFDHSKQVARVRVQDGRVVDVQLEDA